MRTPKADPLVAPGEQGRAFHRLPVSQRRRPPDEPGGLKLSAVRDHSYLRTALRSCGCRSPVDRHSRVHSEAAKIAEL